MEKTVLGLVAAAVLLGAALIYLHELRLGGLEEQVYELAHRQNGAGDPGAAAATRPRATRKKTPDAAA